LCWGLEVDKGWLPLINELSAALEKEIKQYKEDHPDLDSQVLHPLIGVSR
jgi:hypothetical protein